jgi:putative membrane protein
VRVVYWVLVLAVAALSSVFAVANREPVSLGLWPLPFLLELPLYLAVFLSLFAGFIGGATAAWLGGRRRRRQLRRCRRRNEALARELAATQSQLASEARESRPALPATR